MRTSLVFLLFVAPLFAQTAQKIDVRVINVDVAVIDAAGKAVTNLTKGDFEVLEDGQPQAVTNFLQLNRPVKAEARRPSSDLQFRRRLILIVATNYIDKADRNAPL